MLRINVLPDVAYLIINWEVCDAHIYFLIDFPVIWVQVENNLIGDFFHNLKDRLGSICEPDCDVGMDVDELFVINLKATLVNCS